MNRKTQDAINAMSWRISPTKKIEILQEYKNLFQTYREKRQKKKEEMNILREKRQQTILKKKELKLEKKR